MVHPIRTLQEARRASARLTSSRTSTSEPVTNFRRSPSSSTGCLRSCRESYAGLERKVEVRTAELQETLAHQRAAASILGIIASSVEDAKPVFDAIARAASSVIQNARVQLFLVRDGELHHVGGTGLTDEQHEKMTRLYPRPLARTSYAGIAILEKRTLHVPDVLADPNSPELTKTVTETTGLRAILAVYQ